MRQLPLVGSFSFFSPWHILQFTCFPPIFFIMVEGGISLVTWKSVVLNRCPSCCKPWWKALFSLVPLSSLILGLWPWPYGSPGLVQKIPEIWECEGSDSGMGPVLFGVQKNFQTTPSGMTADEPFSCNFFWKECSRIAIECLLLENMNWGRQIDWKNMVVDLFICHCAALISHLIGWESRDSSVPMKIWFYQTSW